MEGIAAGGIMDANAASEEIMETSLICEGTAWIF